MDRWQLATYVLPQWGEGPMDVITKEDVKALLQELADGKLAVQGKPTRVAPRNFGALLKRMFDWVADQGLLPSNPAAGVKLPARGREHLKKGGQDRVLSDEELAARQRQAPVSAAAFRLMLLTAQRPGDVLSMRWVGIEYGTWWVMPAEVAKNDEASRVPLSPPAQRTLARLEPHTGESGWVLQSPVKPEAHQATLKQATCGILARARMWRWTPVDLECLLGLKASVERTRVPAMAPGRVLEPGSKLATARGPGGEGRLAALRRELGLESVSPDQL